MARRIRTELANLPAQLPSDIRENAIVFRYTGLATPISNNPPTLQLYRPENTDTACANLPIAETPSGFTS